MRKYILAVAAMVALALSTGVALAQSYMLESTNFPGMFIRHRNFQAVLTTVENNQDKKDAVFSGRTGLTGFNISFESYNFPGHYLRHKNFKLVLEKDDGSELFKQDATFLGTKQGNGGYTFQAVNFPGFFLRHKDFKLVLEQSDGSALFLADSTFRMQNSGPVEEPPPVEEAPPTPPPGGVEVVADVTGYSERGGGTECYLVVGDRGRLVQIAGDDNHWVQVTFDGGGCGGQTVWVYNDGELKL